MEVLEEKVNPQLLKIKTELMAFMNANGYTEEEQMKNMATFGDCCKITVEYGHHCDVVGSEHGDHQVANDSHDQTKGCLSASVVNCSGDADQTQGCSATAPSDMSCFDSSKQQVSSRKRTLAQLPSRSPLQDKRHKQNWHTPDVDASGNDSPLDSDDEDSSSSDEDSSYDRDDDDESSSDEDESSSDEDSSSDDDDNDDSPPVEDSSSDDDDHDYSSSDEDESSSDEDSSSDDDDNDDSPPDEDSSSDDDDHDYSSSDEDSSSDGDDDGTVWPINLDALNAMYADQIRRDSDYLPGQNFPIHISLFHLCDVGDEQTSHHTHTYKYVYKYLATCIHTQHKWS